MQKYSINDIRKTLKSADSWWTVLVVDPFAIRSTLLLANRTSVSPNLVSAFTILAAAASGFLFSRRYLVFGALAYELAFLLDCIDGKLAMLKGSSSDLGCWLDSVSDKIRLLACASGLAIGYPDASLLALVFVGLYLWDETESLLFSKMLGSEERNSAQHGAERAPLPIRIRERLKARRISGPLSLVEQDTVVFFLMPIIGLPILGIKIGIVMNLIGRLITIAHFWFWRHRRRP
jgi:hypothetical protein